MSSGRGMGGAGDAFGGVGAIAPPPGMHPDPAGHADDDDFLGGSAGDPGGSGAGPGGGAGGWAGASSAAESSLAPLGPTRRPNGVLYRPRRIGPHEDLAWLRECRAAGEHALLYGPPGTGKTAFAEAAFTPDAVTGAHHGFEALVCTGDTAEADFTGTWVQNAVTNAFQWAPGPLHRAVLEDVPLYVDEIFLTPPQVLSVLYSVMDGRGVLRITANPELEPLTIGSGFFVVAAGNPEVPGAVFSDALRSRFDHHVEVTTDWALARELGVPEDITTVAKHLDEKRRQGRLTWSPQLREVLAYAAACRRHGLGYALSGLVAKAPGEDRDVIADALSTKFGTAVQPLALGGRHGR